MIFIQYLHTKSNTITPTNQRVSPPTPRKPNPPTPPLALLRRLEQNPPQLLHRQLRLPLRRLILHPSNTIFRVLLPRAPPTARDRTPLLRSRHPTSLQIAPQTQHDRWPAQARPRGPVVARIGVWAGTAQDDAASTGTWLWGVLGSVSRVL